MSEKSPLLLLGIGTSGCSIARGVSRAFGDGLRYALADTDAASGQPGGPFTLLGGDRLSGRGTGGDVVAGRLAAENSIKTIDEHLAGIRLAIIVTSLGGGTGGGATLETAKYLSDCGIPCIVFATTPFAFEGEDRQRNSRGVMSMIEDTANASFFIPLDKLISDTDNMNDAMRRAIDTMASGITFFWRLLEKPGYIRLDVERIRHLLAQTSRGRFVTITTQGSGRAKEATEKIMASEMLSASSGPVTTALCGILAGNDLLLSEVGEIADCVRNTFGGLSFELATVNDEQTFSGRISVVVMLFEGRSCNQKDVRTGSVMGGRKRHRNALGVGPAGRGRFNNSEPTIWNGEDLDLPTFVRKNLNLDF